MTQAPPGSNQANDFVHYYDLLVAKNQEIKDANADRRAIFSAAKAAGHNVRAIKRALKDSQVSGAQREADDHDYRQMMSWLNKPVGLGVPSANGASMPSEPVMTDHERKEADLAGYTVGKMGGQRDANPWTPGTLRFSAHDGGWQRGAEERDAAVKAAQAPTHQTTRPPPGTPRAPANTPGTTP